MMAGWRGGDEKAFINRGMRKMKKTVLITGSTGGIGAAVALQFAREGWNILGQYRSSERKARALKRSLEKFNAACVFWKVDFLSKAQTMAFIRKMKAYEIHSLVNNAGAYVVKRHFKELTLQNLTDSFMVNTFAPIVLATHVFDRMQKKKYGRIVNISSIAAKYGGGFVYSMHYGCAKRALEGLTKTLARQGAKDNILVNTVRPGVIDTGFHGRSRRDIEKRVPFIPLQRMGTPEEVARLVFYLGSDENQFMTSETVTISGGE